MEQNTTLNEIKMLSEEAKVSMSDAWFEYATPDNFWIKSRFRFLTRGDQVQLMVGKRLLEIGSGNGMAMQQFERIQGVEIDGCDLNLYALNNSIPVKGQLFCLDVRFPPPEMIGAYDGIILLDVIEHIENDGEFLKNCLKFVRADGIVIVHVPALKSLFSKYDEIVGHFRRYTSKDLNNLFSELNITPIKIAYWGFSLLLVAWIRKIIMRMTPREKVVKIGFQPPSKGINTLFNFLLKVENKLTGSPWLGTSVYGIGRISKTHSN